MAEASEAGDPAVATAEPEAAVEVATKVCRICGEEKPLLTFRLDKRCADGRISVCDDCTRERRKAKEAPLSEKPEASASITQHFVGMGTCKCGEYDTLYALPGDDRPLCYACFSRRQWEAAHPRCANPECNEPVRPADGKRPPKYCSIRCRTRAGYLQKKERQAAAAAVA